MRTWLTGILTGLLYGVLFALAMHYLAAEDWNAAVIAGAVTGPPFGIVVTILQRRTNRLMSTLPSDLTKKQRQTAARASRRGPVPTDPAVRAAALNFAHQQLERYGARWMRVALVVAPLFLVLSAVAALLDDDRQWWSGILQLAGAAMFGFMAFEPRRLRRRVAVLSAPAAGSS
jgi:hypothetical protein